MTAVASAIFGGINFTGTKMALVKPFKTIDEQLQILRSRGLCGEDATIVHALKTIGYYRLSGYSFFFKEDEEKFKEGTDINDILGVYEADKALRTAIFSALSDIEVFAKTQIAYIVGANMTTKVCISKEQLSKLSNKDYDLLTSKCKTAFTRSKEEFILHFKENYSKNYLDLPPWMLVNIIDFGTTVTIYKGLPRQLKKKISEPVGLTYSVFGSWLLSLNTLRNICAHHGRLWNRKLSTVPAMPKSKTVDLLGIPFKFGHLSQFLVILEYLLRRINRLDEWKNVKAASNKLAELDKKLFKEKEEKEEAPHIDPS